MRMNLRDCQYILIILLLPLTYCTALASSISEEKMTSSLQKKTSRAGDEAMSEDRINLFFKNMIDKEDYIPPHHFEFYLTTNQTVYLLETIIKKMRQPCVKDKTYTQFERSLRVWLGKFERQVLANGFLNEVISLLELYEYPETEGKRKKAALIAAIEKEKKVYPLNEMLLMANYYYYVHLNDKAKKWHDRIFNQCLAALTATEKLTLAKWYFEGNGVISCNLLKAREVYSDVLCMKKSSDRTKALCISWIERIDRRSSLVH